ncbi:MAG TPA: DNA repair exonuclease [Candidatus Limnocylindrales bacterium]|nr:DNA repair exonuclease [Candidatus Limnocylindrales bacterium]
MLRLLHTADVHLGARHADLGEQAAAQRERQFAAFTATIDLAIRERVDVVLIAGDLFDSNTQPRRSVERVAAQLERLVAARIRTVVIPGTHDVYDRSSIYRAYDLKAMASSTPDDDFVTVLTPDVGEVHLRACDAIVYATVFPTKRAPRSPLEGVSVAADRRATWRVGMVHGAIAIPGRTDGDDVVVTKEQIAATGLDFLALGHWHSTQHGKAGPVMFAYAGAPEPIALDQDRAGKALLVTLEEVSGARSVSIEERVVGRTTFDKVEVDAATIRTQADLARQLAARADPDLVLDVRIVGVRPDQLDLNPDEIEGQLRPSFLKVRVRDASLPALTEGAIPSAETVVGAFIRDVEGRIAELEAGSQGAEAGELRDALRLGRLLLAGHEVAL